MIRFIVTGDFQSGNKPQMPNKVGIIDTINLLNPDYVIHCGDLTDLGEGGKLSRFINYVYYNIYNFFLMFKIRRFQKVNYPPTQYESYKNDFVNKLNPNIKLLECLGNHDLYAHPCKPVKNYIVRKFGKTYYKKYFSNLAVYCLNVYPTKKISDWLRKQINKNIDEPFICFFHYPIVGFFDDWWKQDEKDYFYNIIHDKKCLAIYVGHTHVSNMYQYNNVSQYDGSGQSLYLVTYNPDNQTLTHELIPNNYALNKNN